MIELYDDNDTQVIIGSGDAMTDGGDVDEEEEVITGAAGGESISGGDSVVSGGWSMLTFDGETRVPVEIGEDGCFNNVIEKQQNPPTQNSKFIDYQVKKQENQAATTKLFAFGRFV